MTKSGHQIIAEAALKHLNDDSDKSSDLKLLLRRLSDPDDDSFRTAFMMAGMIACASHEQIFVNFQLEVLLYHERMKK